MTLPATHPHTLSAAPPSRRASLARLGASPWRPWLLLMGPALAILLAVYIYPLAKLLIMSLGEQTFGFSAYRKFFASPVYLAVLVRTLRISAFVTVVCLVAAYPVAYLLARSRPATVRILMAAILVPLWTSILVRTYAWMVLLQKNGVLNNLLQHAGLIDAPLALMYNEAGVVIGMTQVLLPFAILPIYASLTMIDPRLHAAARIMGAGVGRRFRTITFPLSLPGVAAAALLVFVQGLGFFITPALLGGSRVITLAMVIETQVVELLDWPLAAATSMVLLAVTTLLVVGFDRALGIDKVWR